MHRASASIRSGPRRCARRCSGLIALVILPFALSACLLPSLPSQGSPTCSWESQVPPHSDAICTRTVRELQRLATAVAAGDGRTINSLVVDPQTADKMLVYSQRVRAQHVRGLHIVPSIALDVETKGTIGAGFYVLGLTPRGKLNSQETLYFRWVGGRYVVAASDLDKDW